MSLCEGTWPKLLCEKKDKQRQQMTDNGIADIDERLAGLTWSVIEELERAQCP